MTIFRFFASNALNKYLPYQTWCTFRRHYEIRFVNGKTPLIDHKFNKIANKKLHTSKMYGNISKPTKKELILKIKDNIPEEYKIIYKTSLDNYLLAAQIFSSGSMFIVMGIGLIKYMTDSGYITLLNTVNFNSFASSDIEMLLYTLSFIIANTSLQIIINRFPKRIYYNDKISQYIAVHYGVIPLQSKKFEFKKGEAKKAPVTGVFPWRDSRYVIGNRKWILLENGFKTGYDLENMLEKCDSEE